jgi:hypothetical protein
MGTNGADGARGATGYLLRGYLPLREGVAGFVSPEKRRPSRGKGVKDSEAHTFGDGGWRPYGSDAGCRDGRGFG